MSTQARDSIRQGKELFSPPCAASEPDIPVVMQAAHAVLHPGMSFLQPVRLDNRGGASPE